MSLDKILNIPVSGGLITAELEGIVAKALPIVKLSGSSPWIPVICPDLLSKDCKNAILKDMFDVYFSAAGSW